MALHLQPRLERHNLVVLGLDLHLLRLAELQNLPDLLVPTQMPLPMEQLRLQEVLGVVFRALLKQMSMSATETVAREPSGMHLVMVTQR